MDVAAARAAAVAATATSTPTAAADDSSSSTGVLYLNVKYLQFKHHGDDYRKPYDNNNKIADARHS
jgi:hypothetical protein